MGNSTQSSIEQQQVTICGMCHNHCGIMVHVEDVEFRAEDGFRLRGWLLRGDPARPSCGTSHCPMGTRSIST